MKIYNNQYAQKIHAIMLPLVGDFMASGVLKTQTKNIGIDEESIKPENLTALSEAIKKGLSLFLGSEKAEKIAAQIRLLK